MKYGNNYEKALKTVTILVNNKKQLCLKSIENRKAK